MLSDSGEGDVGPSPVRPSRGGQTRRAASAISVQDPVEAGSSGTARQSNDTSGETGTGNAEIAGSTVGVLTQLDGTPPANGDAASSSGSETSTSDSDSDSDSDSTSATDDLEDDSENSDEEEEKLEKLLHAARLFAQNRHQVNAIKSGTDHDFGRQEDVLRLDREDDVEKRDA